MTDDEALRRIRALCSRLEGAEESELQGRPLFHVRRRRFAILNLAGSPARRRWDGCGLSLHLLADPDEIDALRADARFTPSPHHGDRGWLALSLSAPDLDWTEVGELLRSAHGNCGRIHP